MPLNILKQFFRFALDRLVMKSSLSSAICLVKNMILLNRLYFEHVCEKLAFIWELFVHSSNFRLVILMKEELYLNLIQL